MLAINIKSKGKELYYIVYVTTCFDREQENLALFYHFDISSQDVCQRLGREYWITQLHAVVIMILMRTQEAEG